MTAQLEAVHPVLMVRDVLASLRFYRDLGFDLAFADSETDPKYAIIRRDGVELHLQWHEGKDFSIGDRPTYRFVVRDVDGLFEEFTSRASGLDRSEVANTLWGTREFHVRDLDRNGLQFYRAL